MTWQQNILIKSWFSLFFLQKCLSHFLKIFSVIGKCLVKICRKYSCPGEYLTVLNWKKISPKPSCFFWFFFIPKESTICITQVFICAYIPSPFLFRCFLNKQLKQNSDYVPYAIIHQRDALCHILYCLLFSVKISPFLFWCRLGLFCGGFFPVPGQIPEKIFSTGDVVSSLWAIWRILLQRLLHWADCAISFISFKLCLSFKYCELDEVIHLALKSTQLVRDPDQHRSSLCVKPFSIPLG